MRNFHQIAENVAVLKLMHQVARHPELWNEHRFRTEFPNTPHAQVDDIWLRFSDPEKCTTTSNVIGDDRPVWYPAAKILDEAKPIILDLMRFLNGYELGRVLITRLRPGGTILAHRDDAGEYVHMKDIARYHVVLNGKPGSLYHDGDETVCMQTGSIWWFLPTELHAVENNSDDDRIHLLVDIRVWP